jgi:cell shape-determining protein MreC
MQLGATATTQAVQDAVGARRDDVPRGQLDALAAERDQLARQLEHQSVRITELEGTVAVLTGLRERLDDPRARLVRAAVLAFDASPRRESLLIDRGAMNTSAEGRPRVGQWVAAGLGPAEQDSADSGRAQLARQWLLGRISEVHGFTSRVQLASDPQFGPVRVRAARRLQDGALQVEQRDCLLEGRGTGRMVIRQAPNNYFAAGSTLVLVPRGADSPATLEIGRVIGASPVANAPLMFDHELAPIADYRSIRHVFIIATGG